MTLKFRDVSPVAVNPLPTPKPQVTAEGAKSAFLGLLGSAVGYEAISQKIEESTFSLVGDTLEIQTNLSAAMLPLVMNEDISSLMEGALHGCGAGNIGVKFLAAKADTAAPGSSSGSFRTSAPPFKRLVESAAKLNKVSDQLTTQIEQIDAALRGLNLGVTAWVTISSNEDEDGNWSKEQLGYARIGSRWGVALKTCLGMRGVISDSDDDTFSAFADAPRQLRIRAIPHIPKLIDQLSVEAEAMIAKLSPEVDEVSALAVALQASGVKK